MPGSPTIALAKGAASVAVTPQRPRPLSISIQTGRRSPAAAAAPDRAAPPVTLAAAMAEMFASIRLRSTRRTGVSASTHARPIRADCAATSERIVTRSEGRRAGEAARPSWSALGDNRVAEHTEALDLALDDLAGL